MGPSLIEWWRKDVARNTYIYTNFLLGLAFAITATYATYQIQAIGFVIGLDLDGQPCTSTYCIVPFGSNRLDLNSVLLYANAITFALGGVVTLFIVAYADFWKYKSQIVSGLIVVYGALGIPLYWLSAPTLYNFNALLGILIVYNVITNVFIAILNIYIPHCMRQAVATVEQGQVKTARKYGFVMTAAGILASNVSAIIVFAIVAILNAKLPVESQQSAGLLMASVLGFVTLFGAIPSWLGLPSLPTRQWPASNPWLSAIKSLGRPFQKLVLTPNMLLLLLAYTVYTDTTFALGSIILQLFYVQVAPSPLEYTLFQIANLSFASISTLVLLIVQRYRRFNVEYCLILGYALIILVPVWGSIGIANQDAFGDKHRWEFYVQQLLISSSTIIVNVAFKLLYAEFIPAGEEVMWYGLQVVISCATTWVAFVATGPLQNATHNLRFPLIVCLIFLLIPLGLEIFRLSSKKLKREAEVLHDQSHGEGVGVVKESESVEAHKTFAR